LSAVDRIRCNSRSPELGTANPAIRRESRRPAALVLLLLVLLVSSSGVGAQANSPSEYQVKAAFLFNFAKFIDWPSNSFDDANSPFTVCVLGHDPFGHALDDELHGKIIGDRPLAVQRLKDKAQARRCQVVFVSSSESTHQSEILESLRGASMLLVGEANNFATSGGTIQFTTEDNHVRFTINIDAANRSGLNFSSKLLGLAKIVHDEANSKGG
jgi:hypothetical protein